MYFTLSTGSAYGYRYGTSADFSKATALPAGSYSETQSGSYTTLRFTNSFLDSLANGSYYFFYVLDNNNTRVCMNSGSSALRISGSGSPVVPPTIDDYMVDYISGIDSWYSGDEKLGFSTQPNIGKNGGIAVDGYKVPGERPRRPRHRPHLPRHQLPRRSRYRLAHPDRVLRHDVPEPEQAPSSSMSARLSRPLIPTSTLSTAARILKFVSLRHHRPEETSESAPATAGLKRAASSPSAATAGTSPSRRSSSMPAPQARPTPSMSRPPAASGPAAQLPHP